MSGLASCFFAPGGGGHNTQRLLCVERGRKGRGRVESLSQAAGFRAGCGAAGSSRLRALSPPHPNTHTTPPVPVRPAARWWWRAPWLPSPPRPPAAPPLRARRPPPTRRCACAWRAGWPLPRASRAAAAARIARDCPEVRGARPAAPGRAAVARAARRRRATGSRGRARRAQRAAAA